MVLNDNSKSLSKRHRSVEDDEPRVKRLKTELKSSHGMRNQSFASNLQTSPLSDESVDRDPNQTRGPKRTKKERKNNRSSKIHSLRNQLARGSLPQTIHQEKERELAALLLDQEKDKLQKDGKKNLKRYHYVRFLERQKAEKRLKQLRSLQENSEEDGDVAEQIHDMEVNLNYAIYAPLGQKYISVFAKPAKRNKAGNKETNPAKMRKQDFAILSADQQRELREAANESSGVLSTIDSSELGAGTKPPMWYEVEEAMKKGQVHLEALRDGRSLRSNQGATGLAERRRRDKLEKRSFRGPMSKIRVEPTSVREDRGMDSPLVNGDAISDEDMSDGGFFER